MSNIRLIIFILTTSINLTVFPLAVKEVHTNQNKNTFNKLFRRNFKLDQALPKRFSFIYLFCNLNISTNVCGFVHIYRSIQRKTFSVQWLPTKIRPYTKIFWTANFATVMFTWQRPVKHLRWIILQELLTGFSL